MKRRDLIILALLPIIDVNVKQASVVHDVKCSHVARMLLVHALLKVIA